MKKDRSRVFLLLSAMLGFKPPRVAIKIKVFDP